MNEQFMKQAEDMMQAAKNAHLPENLQAMAEEGVARSRDTYQKFTTVAKDATTAAEQLVGTAANNTRSLSEQALANMTANTEAAFDAAEAVARARSIPEAARLQADFFQQQMAIAGEQTKSFFEMSTRMMRETAEHANGVAAKAMNNVRDNA